MKPDSSPTNFKKSQPVLKSRNVFNKPAGIKKESHIFYTHIHNFNTFFMDRFQTFLFLEIISYIVILRNIRPRFKHFIFESFGSFLKIKIKVQKMYRSEIRNRHQKPHQRTPIAISLSSAQQSATVASRASRVNHLLEEITATATSRPKNIFITSPHPSKRSHM